MSYYTERMWCRHCEQDVRYLQSTETAYCSNCGARVQLFTDEDIKRIRKLLGTFERPRKQKAS